MRTRTFKMNWVHFTSNNIVFVCFLSFEQVIEIEFQSCTAL